MFGKKKRKLLIWSVIFSISVSACSEDVKSIAGHEIHGESQGTTYTIIVAENDMHVSKAEVDELLAAFDTILSTYIPSSEISQLNESKVSYSFNDSHHFFQNCYELSEQVYSESDGAFDPSVFPLVKGWGFFKKMETPLRKEAVDSIRAFVSFEKNHLHAISFKNDSVFFQKKDDRFKLDFNAIAQGYSIDVLYDLLEAKGHNNFYIELGGELRVKGKNREGENWRIGIDTPQELNAGNSERSISGILSVTDKAIATSGNYRNFYEKDGKKFAHTLDPKTGFPVQHSLLSATVIADNCAIADAFATAFMVVGLEEAKSMLKKSKFDLDVVLIYENGKGELEFFTSENAQKMLLE